MWDLTPAVWDLTTAVWDPTPAVWDLTPAVWDVTLAVWDLTPAALQCQGVHHVTLDPLTPNRVVSAGLWSTEGQAACAHSAHRFPAPSSKLCQI